jgi:predicted nuclease of predicted toxin-antitoxin system
MKILLDENIPNRVTTNFGKGYETRTVRDMGWLGKKNGELLGLMVLNGFDFFITLDKNLKHQQNLSKFDITIFILLTRNNKHQTLQPLIDSVKQILENRTYKKLNEIEIGILDD